MTEDLPAILPFPRERLEQRLEELRESAQFRNYERVRERVLDMKDRAVAVSGVDSPSAYWSEELEYIDYMFDASPLVIAKLRQHCFYLTNIRAYDYRPRPGLADRRAAFVEKLEALTELGGRELLVPESPLLGGFGYAIDGNLYNVDTLKFYEFVIGLAQSGVLDPFRQGEHRYLCEIGSGWGGFAMQFKMLCPSATIVLVDFADLFLFSATYLMTVFPDAEFRFWGDSSLLEELEGNTPPDFVFVPQNEVHNFVPSRVDAVVNMVSFQEMTTEQVRAYVSWAADRQAPTLYSLNRDRSPFNAELSNVRELLNEAYEITEMDLLPVSYTKLGNPWTARSTKVKLAAKVAKKRAKATRRSEPVAPAEAAAADTHLDYRHVVGRLRD